ncbi:hypothetical protein SODALDRAFT_278519 [Sodiomyces alkalinus F11]|uniref:Pentatricopeptide repeat domain-containing protein n=1 Tax=Sodiomyces alkalinus (strain CBS 110278 / VKM F-3762 / F11) TaxID=1314773 RepID=A0A3N2PV06_SODAK|nr:hypothetical protein SODALDRAFT_278519 [Sodiomyces alkalinus F11]ROT38176.1 hypothetical protein SODALDRAFT_278519 [Sodiomyces alkalinus F11]
MTGDGQDSPTHLRHWQSTRSHLSWHQTNSLTDTLVTSLSPQLLIPHLLQAVQRQDAPEAYSLLKVFITTAPSLFREAAAALTSLPRTCITQIFQTLDPVEAGSRLDCTHGLLISENLQEYSPVARAFDELGVRKIYKDVFATLLAFADIVIRHGHSLIIPEYIVLLRCAGATSDPMAAKDVWKMMDKAGVTDARTGHAHDEFMKARFLTEPLYLQNDLARGRLRPRNLSGARKTRSISSSLRGRLEKLRLYRTRARRFQYGQAPHQPERDLARVLSLPHPLKRIWHGLINRGIKPDHQLYCTYMIACGRVGNLFQIIHSLAKDLGLEFSDVEDHRLTNISGGFNFPRGSSLAPTTRLLHAVVHSLGTAGYVVLAKKVLQHLSRRYGLTIPATTWSDLLEYTYMSSTHDARTEWALFEARSVRNRDIQAQDVIDVWETMLSEPYNTQPTLEDLDKYTNALLQVGRFEDAVEAIRLGSSHYHSLTHDVHDALAESLYPSALPSATDQYLRAKARQHRSWFTIQRWCERWLRRTSRQNLADETVSTQAIPDFVAEFRAFIPSPAVYHTPGGLVRLFASEGTKAKYRWRKEEVQSTPTLVLRRDKTDPVVGGERGEQLRNEQGQPLYHRKNRLFQQTFERGVRVRRTLAWEEVGVLRYCMREADDVRDGARLPSLRVGRMADCVEW